MSSKLKELRNIWEEGLNLICEIPVDGDAKPNPQCFVAILQDEDKTFHMHRYMNFSSGNNWDVSVDAQRVKADKIFETIKDLHSKMTFVKELD